MSLFIINPFVSFPPAALGGSPWLESFNKADGQLGPDQSWTTPAGAAVVASNQATSSGSATVHYGILSQTPAANQYAQVAAYKNGGSASLQRIRAIVRYTNTSNFYFVDLQANNNVNLNKNVAGSFTTLGSASHTWVDGDVLRIEANGTTIRALINGVQVLTSTDSSHASGSIGFACVHSGAAIRTSVDNFQGGNL